MRRICSFLVLVLLGGAVAWLAWPAEVSAPDEARAVEGLHRGVVASLDSPAFVFGPGWRVSGAGADTSEPARPWQEPSGRISFQYTGRELALQLAVGHYWGYLFVTVDGRPANRLPALAGTLNSHGQRAGYKPLLTADRQTPTGPAATWFVVHRARTDGPHDVTIEVWRGWGQTVLRAVAVDALPPGPRPLWPGMILALFACWLGMVVWGPALAAVGQRAWAGLGRAAATPWWGWLAALPGPVVGAGAVAGLLLVAAGVSMQSWLLTDGGLLLLGVVSCARPVVWVAALLFGLPFYLAPLPLLPGRALNLIEIGVYGGLVVLGWRLLLGRPGLGRQREAIGYRPHHFLVILIVLALVSALAAEQRAVALREWRTLFLPAGLFALLLRGSLASGATASRTLLVLAWLAGGAAISLAGIWQYIAEQGVIQAEGVNRVRAFYGSPNNLALYLERSAAMGLALAYFGGKVAARGRLVQVVAGALTLPQLIALLLTFSKGALFLALPALLLALAVAGRRLLRARGLGSARVWAWGLILVAVGMGLGLLPFLSTERFRALLDFGPQTTAGLRLNLWRSSLQMALDSMWLGVGPDNFLYTYRSGYILPAAWRDPNLNHPHNIVLDWWTRLGLPGLVLALAWLGTGIRGLWRAASGDVIAVGALAAIAAGLAHGLIDASYALPDLLLVWVFLTSAERNTSGE